MNFRVKTHSRKALSLCQQILVTIFVILYWVSSTPLLAETDLTPADQRTVDQVFESVTSPFCPGRLLKDCPSSAASELKDRVRLKVKQGESAEQVIDYLLQLYGQELLAVPRLSGFGLIAWIAPFLFLGLGATFIFLWLSRRRPAQGGPTAEIDQVTRLKIEEQLNS